MLDYKNERTNKTLQSHKKFHAVKLMQKNISISIKIIGVKKHLT